MKTRIRRPGPGRCGRSSGACWTMFPPGGSARMRPSGCCARSPRPGVGPGRPYCPHWRRDRLPPRMAGGRAPGAAWKARSAPVRCGPGIRTRPTSPAPIPCPSNRLPPLSRRSPTPPPSRRSRTPPPRRRSPSPPFCRRSPTRRSCLTRPARMRSWTNPIRRPCPASRIRPRCPTRRTRPRCPTSQILTPGQTSPTCTPCPTSRTLPPSRRSRTLPPSRTSPTRTPSQTLLVWRVKPDRLVPRVPWLRPVWPVRTAVRSSQARPATRTRPSGRNQRKPDQRARRESAGGS